MARNDALRRIRDQLMTRRRELLRAINNDFNDLSKIDRGGNDDADDAALTITAEMTSQLAEMETRELKKIEKALARIREGNYGKCEYCGVRIPVARLNALPDTTCCIKCQRQQEEHPNDDRFQTGNWQKVFDA